MGEIYSRSGDGAVQDSFHSVLTRMVEAVSEDHAQLRVLIYEFARIRLRKDLYGQYKELGWTGIAARVLALEAAIDQVEADAIRKSAALAADSDESHQPELQSIEDSTDSAIRSTAVVPLKAPREVIRAEFTPPILPDFLRPRQHTEIEYAPVWRARPDDDASERGGRDKKSHLNFWWTVQLVVAVFLGLAIYGLIDDQFAGTLLRLGLGRPHPSADAGNVGKADQSVPKTSERAVASEIASPAGFPNIPIPRAFGVYAYSGSELISLDRLPIPAPDPRVAISAVISTPSRSHVPPGPIQFVIYRRDLVSEAPDRVSLRVVAQVKRVLAFGSDGKPNINSVDNAWVVRNNAYQMSVAPVPNHSDMVVIRSDDPKFTLPAGRYAIALKNVAYDFTVEGPIVDSAHCLERTEALNAPVYTECRNP